MEIAFAAIRELLASGLSDIADVTGVAVTSQMHGVLLVDAGLHPVTNLITWRDQRSTKLAEIRRVKATSF